MPVAAIPFANLLSGHERLGGASPAALNIAVDANGVLRRRPAIQSLDAAGSAAVDTNGVNGVHVTSTGTIYATGGSGATRTVYRVNGGSSSPVGGLSSMSAPRRPVFAETETLLVIAAGADMHKVNLASNEGAKLGGNPPRATHVIFNAARLLANDPFVDRSKIRYSDPASSTVFAGHEVWDGSGTSGFLSAEARPDPVVAIGDSASEVFAWGSTNLEVYGPDGLLIFGRGSTRDHGCIAPYSIVRYDSTFVWLDSRKRFVQSDGRTVREISQDIGPLLDSIETVSDCFGYRVNAGPVDALVFTFPSAGQTLAYQAGTGWCRWGSYVNSQPGELQVTASAHDPTTDTNVVALDTGRVCQLADGFADDLGDPIRAYVETGGVDHGTAARKSTKHVRFILERGRSISSSEPAALLQWADRPGAWCAPRPVSLGRSGDTRTVVTLSNLGIYRTRFWRFTFSADTHMALAAAEEDYEIVRE